MLTVGLLGTPTLTVDGSAVMPDTRKALALLAYLGVEGPTGRDTMAALLWPDSPDGPARATLRRTLSAVRSVAGADVIDSDRQQMRLTDAVDVDVHHFDEAVRRAAEHSHGDADVCSTCLPELERAVAVYRGDFMSGFFLRGCADFEDWVRITAESYRMKCSGAYERMAEAYASQGDYQRSIAAMRAWLEADPLREPSYRRLMLLNAWAGNRPGAIDAYRECVAILERELGVDPLEETTELYEAILDDDLPPAPSSRRRTVVRIEPLQETDLIDRDDELKALLTAAARGGHVVRVVGEPWMGKTRLLGELHHHPPVSERDIVTSRGYRTERGLAYGVVGQLMASLAALPGWERTRAGLPGWAIAEAARVFPALGEAPGPIDPAWGETRMLDALIGVLTARPALVVVDDAQWADPASMAFLVYLSNRIETTGATLIFAHRTEDTEAVRQLIESAPGRTDVELGPLEPRVIEELVDDPSLAPTILERTGGVPLLITEALADEHAEVPAQSIRQYMETRLKEVDELTRQVLTAAAVLSGACDIDSLRATSGRSEEELMEAVEQLTSRRILTARPDNTLAFQLDGMAQILYSETSLVRRRTLHRRAAVALARAPGSDREPALAAAVARHHQAGGDEAEAAEWMIRAGDLARGVFANSEAIDSYRTALALGHPERVRLHLSIGDALLFLGRYSEAQTEFEKGAAMGRGDEKAIAEHRLGETLRRLGKLDVAIQHFEAALPEHPEPVTLLSDWTLALLRAGDHLGARLMADRAVEAAQDEPARARSRALAVLGMVTRDLAAAEAALAEALRLAGDDPVLRVAALNALAYHRGEAGDDAEARRLVEEALEITERTGDRHRRGALYNHLADIHHRTGRRHEAETALRESVTLLAEIEPDSWLPEVWLLSRW